MAPFCRVVVCLLAFSIGSHAATRREEIGARGQKPRISVYSHTSCVVSDGGGVRCWGRNNFGQVGNRNTTNQTLPAQVTGLNLVISVVTGHQHTCALLAHGTVVCWGDNQFGQLGNGTTTNSQTPVAVTGLDGVISIASGDSHMCALRVDGTVRCWGLNLFGNLGTGFTNSSTPVTPFGVTNATAITAGEGHSCALISNGTVRCWGLNENGQIGDGSSSSRASGTVSGLSRAVEITAGRVHTCALIVDGTAQCWGANGSGELGDNTTTGRNVPAPVSQLTQAIALEAGLNHTCALRADGSVRCWGLNTNGQLGDGTAFQRLDASRAVVGLNNAVAIAVGFRHTCALDSAGTARCWGANDFGQLGNGTTNPSLTPSSATGVSGTIGARGIVTGLSFTCARRGTGAVACWGLDANGQLGNGDPLANLSTPGVVTGLNDAVALASGDSHVCALRSNGTVACWGDNSSGEVGGGTTNRPAPIAVAGIAGAVSVAVGRDYSCTLLQDGTVRCWGGNARGQLGNNSVLASQNPVSPLFLSGAIAITASPAGRHTCALLVDGTVRCWGDNARGQLGDGSSGSFSPFPVTVAGLSNVVSVAAGLDHTCAVLANGSARCWGSNEFGKLGNSNQQDRTTPDTVSAMTDAVSITAGGNYACALRAGGIADCWGRNSENQLASAAPGDQSTPGAVIVRLITSTPGNTVPIRLTTIVSMTTGAGTARYHTCSVQVTGQPFCWGSNLQGAIGDGTTTDRPRPTGVASFTANVAPEAKLSLNGGAVEATGLLNCEAGNQGVIFMMLTQPGGLFFPGLSFPSQGAIGYGAASLNCGDDLLEVPMTIPSYGIQPFRAGEATAYLQAVVWNNQGIVDQQIWTRDVTLGESGPTP